MTTDTTVAVAPREPELPGQIVVAIGGSDSSALLLVTIVPNSFDANASVVPRSFGRETVTCAARKYDATR